LKVAATLLFPYIHSQARFSLLQHVGLAPEPLKGFADI
jgi:hypothetical protein